MIGFYCAGNWKMNKDAAQAARFVHQLRADAPVSGQDELIVLPPALVAWQVAEGLKGTRISWGGQNCYFTDHGAFTGENSPEVLKSMGAAYCLVGHSERRQLFTEGDELLAKKVQGVQKYGMTPILCVGESLDDRRWSRTQEVVLRQLRMGLQLADFNQPLWVAYEPVWAIGTGLVATPAQVEEVHTCLRKALREWNATASERMPILYGGSVKPDNASGLASLKNVNGFLVGGASLDIGEFLQIYKVAKEHVKT